MHVRTLATLGTLASIACAAVATPLAAQTVVEVPAGTNSQFFGQVPSGFTSSFGQIITAPNDNTILQRFSFQLGRFLQTEQYRFSAYLVGWRQDNAQSGFADGPVLYASPMRMGPLGNTATSFDFVLPGQGVQLVAGRQYMLFLSSIAYRDQLGTGNNAAQVFNPANLGNLYAGGRAVFQAASTGITTLDGVLAARWLYQDERLDAAFGATFVSGPQQVVPEPSTYALLGTGLAGVAGLARARRRRAA